MPELGDSLDPKDDIQARLSRAPAPEELPAELLCPSGHRAFRHVVGVVVTRPTGRDPMVQIPFWACPDCCVTYRYQECTLPPGEEGHP